MTSMETACLWTIGLSASACGWMAFGLGPVLVAAGLVVLIAQGCAYVAKRRRLNRAVKRLQAAWEENRDATGGVT